MGRDTSGVIKGKIPLLSIYTLILGKIDNKAELLALTLDGETIVDPALLKEDVEFARISFKDGENERMLMFATSKDENNSTFNLGDWYTRLVLGYWGNSEQLMLKIVEQFGGWIDVNDCDDIGYYYVEKIERVVD